MTVKKIRVGLKSDHIVLRDPISMERLTTKGKLVPKNNFWIRRLKQGDCILLDNPNPVNNDLNTAGEG
jgi:hypothetical protein